MLSLIRRRLQNLHAAVTTIPDRQTWYRCGALFGASSSVALATGLQSQLVRIELLEAPWPTRLTLPMKLFIFPGVTEELLFRGLLLPHPDEAVTPTHRRAAAIAGVVAFVLWHPLQAVTVTPDARAMLCDRRFLFQTGLLGSACTGAYYLSGSIWPPVVMHWLTVSAWMLLLGGWRDDNERNGSHELAEGHVHSQHHR